jgi:poly(3-hydroxybutyrate) depolymerase
MDTLSPARLMEIGKGFRPAKVLLSAIEVGLVALWLATPALAASVSKEALTIEKDKRTYYLFIPDTVGPEPAPLVIVLHGSGRDGRPLVDLFRGLASKERFIVVGPDATNRGGWQVPADGPAFLAFVVEDVKTKHPVDGRRIYLFGHSAGASFALSMGLMESEYFAGVAAHAVSLPEAGREQLLAAAQRKVPMALFHGTKDSNIPIDAALQTRDVLRKAGFPVDSHELPGYEHNSIYSRGDTVIEPAWDFLKAHALDADPRYQAYGYQKP